LIEIDPKRYEGHWWLPEKPEIRLYGTLDYMQRESIRLTLITDAKDHYLYFEELLEPEIICGHTTEGEEITLLYCTTGGIKFTQLGVYSIRFRAELLLVGHCYSHLGEIEFTSLIVTYSNLTNWLQIFTPFKLSTQEDEEHILEQIKYLKTEETALEIKPLDFQLVYGLTLTSGFSFNAPGKYSLELEQLGFFEIKPRNSQPLNWFFEIVKELRNLLSLLMGFPTYTLTLSASESDHSKPPVRICFVSRPSEFETSLSIDSMLLANEHLSSLTPKVIENWFDKKVTIRTLSDLALGVLLRGHRILEFEFLALVQALESYHEKIHPNCKSKTRFKNEGKPEACSLKERLKEMYDNLQGELQVHIGEGKIDDYLTSIKNTRNFYSHRIVKKGKVFEGEDLNEAVISLATFVTILIFQELGIPSNLIKEALLRGKVSGFRNIWWR